MKKRGERNGNLNSQKQTKNKRKGIKQILFRFITDTFYQLEMRKSNGKGRTDRKQTGKKKKENRLSIVVSVIWVSKI